MRTARWLSFALLIAVAAQARPRIGLVLEGGGALGFAHIGVIQYLEEHHIPVDLVVGTSMGGLVAGLYAIGDSPLEIQELTNNIDWDEVLSGTTPFEDLNFRRKEDRIAFPNRLQLGLRKGVVFPGGLNSGHGVGLVLDRATLAYENDLNFDNLPIPFRCVSTDVTTGKAKVFERGSIAQSMRATMSIPAVFAPVTIDGHVYTDGGAVDNLPVDVAKQAGADIVIAVYLDVGTGDSSAANSMFAVAAKNISIMISSNEMRNMQSADVLLSADLRGFSSSSFKKGRQIIPKGYAAAEKKKHMLAGLALDEQDWDVYRLQRERKVKRTVPVPQFVEVAGDKPAYDRALQESLAKFVGKPVDPPAVEKALTRITGTGVIASAGYTMTTNQAGAPGLAARTYEKTYGPPFLDLGITIDGSDPDNVLFGMGARLTFMDLGGYRAEWRTDGFFGSTYGAQSEYYKPFRKSSKWFYAPHIYVISSPFNIYSGQDRLAQYRIERDGFGMDVGYALNSRSEVRLGEDQLWFKQVRKISVDTLPNTTIREALSSLRYRYYGVDNVELPRQGLNLETGFNWYHRADGYTNFPEAELRASYFQRVSKEGSVILTASGGTSFHASINNLELQAFSLGGPLRLGAYGQNELLGDQYFLFQGGYEHKILPLEPFFGEGVYALGLVEAGKVYGSQNGGRELPIDGSVGVVARTILGPIFLGASFGDNGHKKWWFGLGRVF